MTSPRMPDHRPHAPPARAGFAGRGWTVMVYMAADNDLLPQALADLAEIKMVGSTPQVTVVAQLDSSRAGEPTRRYYLSRVRSLEGDAVAPPLGETNTGDAGDLARFVAWGIETYPAHRYALVLWNHGVGLGDARVAMAPWPDDGRGAAGRVVRAPVLRRPIFRATMEGALARGIAWDAASQDFLDNGEIKRALDAVLLLSGIERLDLLGLDACLMQMLEVAYQARGLARCVVASQEVEPDGGWPYHTILRRLTAWPEADGIQLGTMVVDAYLRACDPAASATQSVLDLSRVDDVVTAVNALCRCVLDNVAVARPLVVGAARAAQRYRDPDSCDLYDFCRVIWDHAAEMPLRARAYEVMSLLAPAGPDRFVAAEGHRGEHVARSHGVSIYYPSGAISRCYRRLDFSCDTLWDDMLRAVLGG